LEKIIFFWINTTKINLLLKKFDKDLGSWWNKCLPSQWFLAGFNDRSVTMGLKRAQTFGWRLQWGIFDNERKLDRIIPRGGW